MRLMSYVLFRVYNFHVPLRPLSYCGSSNASMLYGRPVDLSILLFLLRACP